jgi:hypothetical protein
MHAAMRGGDSCWTIMWKPMVITLWVDSEREPVVTRRMGPGSMRR